jgi:hypothetical protein
MLINFSSLIFFNALYSPFTVGHKTYIILMAYAVAFCIGTYFFISLSLDGAFELIVIFQQLTSVFFSIGVSLTIRRLLVHASLSDTK